jgi:hypothetical protein
MNTGRIPETGGIKLLDFGQYLRMGDGRGGIIQVVHGGLSYYKTG